MDAFDGPMLDERSFVKASRTWVSAWSSPALESSPGLLAPGWGRGEDRTMFGSGCGLIIGRWWEMGDGRDSEELCPLGRLNRGSGRGSGR